MIKPKPDIVYSGDRFRVTYQLAGYGEDDARKIAQFICIEETIEFPYELVSPGSFHDLMVGHIEKFSVIKANCCEVLISYAVETTGFELPQLINVIFGNISFVPGIRVEKIDLPTVITDTFQGPRFGRQGIRDLLGIPKRPIISTALKPMGLSPTQLADMAYKYAFGGVDIIKDDHGLSDQEYCPFRERIPRCVEQIQLANEETGFKTLYFPAIGGKMEEFHDKARFAQEAGVDGMMLIPGFCGLDTTRMLAEDDNLGLPIMFHPGFLGTYRISKNAGLSPFVLHGQLPRLFGADISIFPHYEGRFAPSADDCRLAVDGTEVKMGHLKQIFPSPAGGVKPEFVKDIAKFYGNDVICLVAGNLHRMGSDLVRNSQLFRKEAVDAT